MSIAIETPVLNEQVVSTDFDGGEGVLVDLNSKRYYQLNETAMQIWRGLERGLSADQIVAEMVQVFDVTPDHASKSLERLLRDLHAHKLVHERS
jgi:Coenzyme PQQ synthesis protein D (PqqD)